MRKHAPPAVAARYFSKPARAEAEAKPQPPAQPKGPSSGTGFFVSDSGHVITNAHVVEQCSLLRLTDGRGETHSGPRIVAVDKANDLALLQIGGRPDAHASFRTGARLGESAYVFGFPIAPVLSKTGQFTVGNVASTAGIQTNTGSLQITAPVQPGNSGGPLLDGFGSVIGVVSGRLNDLRMLKDGGFLPQNVNFAIKSEVAMTFLSSHGVSVTTVAMPKALTSAEVATRAKAMSVFIECRN